MDSLMNPMPRLSATEFAKSHYKTPALVEHGVRCGKANCRCATTAHRHATRYLYWRDEMSRPHRRYVPKAEVAAVRAIIAARQREDQWRRATHARSVAQLRALLSDLREELAP